MGEHEAEVLSGEEGITVLRPFSAAADQSLAGLFDD